jgi:hypothetical protein
MADDVGRVETRLTRNGRKWLIRSIKFNHARVFHDMRSLLGLSGSDAVAHNDRVPFKADARFE